MMHTEDLSKISFNLCENSPNSLCPFWNHKSLFTTQLVCIILAQTLHAFDRNITSKFKFSGFSLLESKFIKFLMSFFNKKWVFLQRLDHSSVSWEITLLHFCSWNFKCYWKKWHIKMQIFRAVSAHVKTYQTCHVIFEAKSQYYFKFCITLQCHER